MALLFMQIHIGILDIVDILIVAILMYKIFFSMRNSVGIKILIGFVLLFLVWYVVRAFHMILLSQILGAFMGVGAIALVVVFQPEIRQLLLMLGNVKIFKRGENGKMPFIRLSYVNDHLNIDAIVMACKKMSTQKMGALIGIARYNELESVIQTGTPIDAIVSERLIENIFFKNSPLHDGAMIIAHNKIAVAGAILPVSSNTQISPAYGLRHRAAIGLSETTDAVVVVVSEETGKIAVCYRSNMITEISPTQLNKYLKEEFSK